ncbi:MAG: L,D-transpeptidase, partial [Myxococcota bacterium]
EGLLVVDLGEVWTPYLFSEQDHRGSERMPNRYRETYLALSRSAFPDDHHGARARRDKYLELYGIPPTLQVLRERMRQAGALGCVAQDDLDVLGNFEGFLAYRSSAEAERTARRFSDLESQVAEILREAGVAEPSDLTLEDLSSSDRQRMDRYFEESPAAFAVRAAQRRLECEGFFEGKGRYTAGAFDWATHEALAEFERRHRVYGWGFLGGETLSMLRLNPLEAEREAVLRVLVERAIHAAGVIEDGSVRTEGGLMPQYLDRGGQTREVRDLASELRAILVRSFGIESVEETRAFLEEIGPLEAGEHRLVAVSALELPDYYSGNMDLRVEIDRGDVWYEFPYDEEGNKRIQATSRRPRTRVFVYYLNQRIPIAEFGTTIGGWRTELVEGTEMWRYKNSPVGERVWHQIVAAPVWFPPASTPPLALLTRRRDRYEVNYHETGPSYASAYGLVAAYHRLFYRDDEGKIQIGRDEGIRIHGSVDYMSIMRRHSHGCHRLHNHIAVRLMSFVLAHRPHERRGQQHVAYSLPLEVEGTNYSLDLEEGGYVFHLNEPIPVEVIPGRIRGRQSKPIEHAVPKFDKEIAAYRMPDGTQVAVDRYGGISQLAVASDEDVFSGTVEDAIARAIADAAGEESLIPTPTIVLAPTTDPVDETAAAPSTPPESPESAR